MCVLVPVSVPVHNDGGYVFSFLSFLVVQGGAGSAENPDGSTGRLLIVYDYRHHHRDHGGRRSVRMNSVSQWAAGLCVAAVGCTAIQQRKKAAIISRNSFPSPPLGASICKAVQPTAATQSPAAH